MMNDDVERRFWTKVERGAPDSCWPWKGDKCRAGYGLMRIKYRRWRANRLSLIIATGSDKPANIYALHSCDNPACVNPSHLRWGTPKENTADMLSRGRRGYTALIGEKNGRALLTESDVRAIRQDSRSLIKIAAAFGTSKGTVCNIRARRTWRHLED